MGTTAAALVCQELKIKSPNDRDLLEAAKEKVYGKGFYEGKMIVGEYKGMSGAIGSFSSLSAGLFKRQSLFSSKNSLNLEKQFHIQSLPVPS